MKTYFHVDTAFLQTNNFRCGYWLVRQEAFDLRGADMKQIRTQP